MCIYSNHFLELLQILFHLLLGITGAVSPADFTAVDETITFPTGNLCISVTLVNDDTDEDTEMFGVRATPVTGNIMVMAPNPITVQITDDDRKFKIFSSPLKISSKCSHSQD